MEFVPVKDFAEKVGVSIQAVYKRIKTDLEPFTKEENGVKLISLEALELYKPTQHSKREKEATQRAQELEKENESLKEQIAKLNQEKMDLLANNAEFSAKLLQILEKQAQQQENYQVLLAQNQQLTSRLLNSPTTGESEPKEFSNNGINANRKGLFSRLFKRKK